MTRFRHSRAGGNLIQKNIVGLDPRLRGDDWPHLKGVDV
jgi:hypothetical protein